MAATATTTVEAEAAQETLEETPEAELQPSGMEGLVVQLVQVVSWHVPTVYAIAAAARMAITTTVAAFIIERLMEVGLDLFEVCDGEEKERYGHLQKNNANKRGNPKQTRINSGFSHETQNEFCSFALNL